MHDSSPLSSPRALLVIFLAFTSLWFGGLGYRQLIGPDEGRYAEIGREMVSSGNWITPRLNGIKYFEKPPLQYWATATSFKLFGEGEAAARLWPAGTGFFCVLLTLATGRRLFGADAGILAAAALASSPLFLFIGHLNTLDMGLTLFLQLALTSFCFAQQVPRQRAGRWMALTWIALALAVLSKGLVALVLPAATLVAYSLFSQDFSPWRRLHLRWGIALFLLVAAPWFVAVSLANPEFFHFFFIHEHVERFLTTVHGRYQPWWYFIPIFLIGALPWTVTMLRALAAAWERNLVETFLPRRFLLVWVMVVSLFFSASGSKLPSYILPMFPALALLAGDHLTRVGRTALLTHLGFIAVLAASAIFLPSMWVENGESEAQLQMRYAEWLSVAAAVWLAGTLAAFALAWRRRPRPASLALAAGTFLAATGMLLGHDQIGRANSSHDIAAAVSQQIREDEPFYSVAMYDQTLPFYLRRTVTLVDYADEMSFGLAQEPKRWIPTLQEFKQHWLNDRTATAIMREETYRALTDQGLPMRLVARDTRRIIVRKP